MFTNAHNKSAIAYSSFNISVKKAIKKRPNEAVQSIFKEMAQMVEKKVFKGVKPQVKQKKTAIKSFLFQKEKQKYDGTFDKLESRLVAGPHAGQKTDIVYRYKFFYLS